MFPFTRVPIWVHMLDPLPYGDGQNPRQSTVGSDHGSSRKVKSWLLAGFAADNKIQLPF